MSNFLSDLINAVSTRNNRKLSNIEVDNIITYVNRLDRKKINNIPRHKAIENIAEHFSPKIVDTHEIMKTQLGSGQNSSYRRTPQPQTQPKTQTQTQAQVQAQMPVITNTYFLLDSKLRNLSTDKDTYKWTVIPSINPQQGVVNTVDNNIHNILNIQFDRFTIPYVSSADNVYRKISVLIEEFSPTATVMEYGRRYHMMFDSKIVGNRIELSPPLNDDGRFRFHTPINILDTFTIKFFSPFSPVSFNSDRLEAVITSINATQSICTFSEHHRVTDSELIHITRYATADPIKDHVQMSHINREEGHIVTFIDDYVLRIESDLSTITPDINNTATCFIAARRLIIPIRMEYLKSI